MTEHQIIIEACSTREERGLKWEDIRIELNEALGKNNRTSKTYREIWRKHLMVVDSDETLETIYKEKVKASDRIGINRATLRDIARVEELYDAFSEYRKAPHLIHVKPKPRNGKLPAIINLADWHIGAEHSNWQGDYSVEIAKQRIEYVMNECIAYIDMFDIEDVLILNLGDLIEGNIHVTTRIDSPIDIVEQTIIATEMYEQFIKGIYDTGVNLKVGMVLDNHSRVNKLKPEHRERENLGRAIGYFAKRELREYDIEWIDNKIDDNIGFAHFAGRNIAWVHGHLDDPKSVQAKLSKLIGVQIDHVFIAHRHHLLLTDSVSQSPSLVNAGEYAMNLRLSSQSGQLMVVYDGDTVINIVIGV